MESGLLMLIWIIVSYVVGCISMYVYMIVRLRQFGWNWRMIKGKITEDKLRNRYNDN